MFSFASVVTTGSPHLAIKKYGIHSWEKPCPAELTETGNIHDLHAIPTLILIPSSLQIFGTSIASYVAMQATYKSGN